MVDLAARAEVARFAADLGAAHEDLTFLEAYPAADLRRLRRRLHTVVADDHRAAFKRAAHASTLLPVQLIAPLAERAFGPWLCARIASELDPDHAAQLAGHLPVPFLASVCESLDTVRGADVIRAIPTKRVVQVGEELLRRRAYATLGRFVDVVTHDAIGPILARIDDHALLAVAVAAEGTDRIDEIFGLLTDERIAHVIEEAVVRDEIDAALVVLDALGPEQSGRLLTIALGAGDHVVVDILAAVHRLDAWDRILPLIDRLTPRELEIIAATPGLDDPELVEAVVGAVLEADLGAQFAALVGSMSDDRQRHLATLVVDRVPAAVGPLLAAVDRVPGADGLAAVAVLRTSGP